MILALLVVLVFMGIVLLAVLNMNNENKTPKNPSSNEDKVQEAIREKEKQIKQFESKIAQLLVNQGALQVDVADAKEDVKKWASIADFAVKSGKAEDVRSAVRARMEAEQKHGRLDEELKKITQTIDGLREQLQFAKDKVEYAKANEVTLAARLEAAKIREGLADKPISLEDLEAETMKQEAKATAWEETSPDHKDFLKKNVVQNMDVDAEVERLMKKG